MNRYVLVLLTLAFCGCYMPRAFWVEPYRGSELEMSLFQRTAGSNKIPERMKLRWQIRCDDEQRIEARGHFWLSVVPVEPTELDPSQWVLLPQNRDYEVWIPYLQRACRVYYVVRGAPVIDSGRVFLNNVQGPDLEFAE
jgi:hypothetical protein